MRIFGIRHYGSGLPRDARFCGRHNEHLAIQGTDTVCSSSTVISDHTGRRPQGTQPAVRSKVDDVVAQTSEEDCKSLRNLLTRHRAASALKAKGLSSLEVVAINIADGVLTLITKTA